MGLVVSAGPTSLRPESDHRIYTCIEPHEYVAAVEIINCTSFSLLSLSLSQLFFAAQDPASKRRDESPRDDIHAKGQFIEA